MTDRWLRTLAPRIGLRYCDQCQRLGRPHRFRSEHCCHDCWQDAVKLIHDHGFCLVDVKPLPEAQQATARSESRITAIYK